MKKKWQKIYSWSIDHRFISHVYANIDLVYMVHSISNWIFKTWNVINDPNIQLSIETRSAIAAVGSICLLSFCAMTASSGIETIILVLLAIVYVCICVLPCNWFMRIKLVQVLTTYIQFDLVSFLTLYLFC